MAADYPALCGREVQSEVVKNLLCRLRGVYMTAPSVLFERYKYLILLARPKGFEPLTLGSEVRCSVLLSYGRARKMYRKSAEF
jgi:hypothetical protein